MTSLTSQNSLSSSSPYQHLVSILLNRFTTGEMSPQQVRRLGEFCMREEMLTRLGKQSTEIESDDEKCLKYFTLGWFIYEVIGVEGLKSDETDSIQ